MLFVVLMFACNANAEIYMWEDEEGLLHFGDERPKNMEAKELEIGTQKNQRASSKVAISDKSKISEFSISYEDDSSLHLSIRYYYSGAHTEDAWMSVKTADDGKATRYFSYRPAKLSKGESISVVKVGVASTAPDQYCSSELIATMYNRGGKFHETVFPYEKCWTKKQVGKSESVLKDASN